MSETLFPGYEPEVRQPEPVLSPDQRRTKRQSDNVAAGIHPLTRGPLHMLASKHRGAASPKADPFTCGSCWFRDLVHSGNRKYAKCFQGAQNATDTTVGRLPYVTGGPATDVRSWWPACPEYSPSDRISDDASRSIPAAAPEREVGA